MTDHMTLSNNPDSLFAHSAPVSQRNTPDFTGMRIRLVQMRNFGTYDGPATTFDFNCEGAVMAGGNGMGKSTAFDAIKVAFVTNPDLNNATGEKGERSVTSYYLGAYGDEESEDGTAQAKELRTLGDVEKTMGILVQFENSHGRVFTAVRLLYIDKQGVRTWRYITSNGQLDLDTDFPRVDSEKVLRDRGAANNWFLSRTFKDFMKEVATGLGMESTEQAIRAFRLQAIATGLPQMGSTTDFARTYILPPDNFLVDVAKAVESIEEHRKIRDKIINSQTQLGALDRICRSFNKLESQFEQRAGMMRADSQFDIVREYAGLMQDRQRRRINRRAFQAAQQESQCLDSEIAQARDRITELTQKIEAADGNKIDALEQQRDTAAVTAKSRRAAQRDIHEATSKVGFRRSYKSTSTDWSALERAIPARALELDAREKEIEADRHAVTVAKIRADDNVQKIEEDIRSTKSSRSSLPSDLRAARAELANAIGEDIDNIPFLAELIQVSETYCAEWELAANRLLGGMAQKVLVPENLYARAKGALPKITAPAHLRLEKVEDFDICADENARLTAKIDNLSSDRLAARLDIKDDHAMAPYARAQILARADYACVTNEAFGKTHEKKAICPSGANSASDKRAEIDNRKTHMVLGWGVERRLAALAKDLEEAEVVQKDAADKLAQFTGADTAQRKFREALNWLNRIFKPWDEIDTHKLDAKVARLDNDIKGLQTSEMQQMRTEKKAVDARITELEKEARSAASILGDKTGQVQRDNEAVARRIERIVILRDTAGTKMTAEEYIRIRTRMIEFATKHGGLDPAGVNIYEQVFPVGQRDVIQTFSKLKSGNSADTGNLTKQISVQGVALDKKVSEYFNTYGDERHLPSLVRGDNNEGRLARAEWREAAEKIRDQDLPAAKEAAADFRKTALHQHVLTLRNKLTTYDDQARKISRGINQIMAGNVFNPATGSYARLRLRQSANPYHRDLVRLLDEVLNGYTELSDEEVFAHVTAIADYLSEDDRGPNHQRQNVRRREIAQLSNRFDAEVQEYRILSDGSEKMSRRITGSGTLSGGEKDRLSNFLLAAAMKCAFGGHDDNSKDYALSTILIDEAFNRSTEENAAAQVLVLDSFDLQVIAATPKSKIRPFQPVIGGVFTVGRPTNLQTAIRHTSIDEVDFSAYEVEDEVPVFGDEGQR